MKVLHLISGGDTGGAKTHVFALLGALKNRADVKIVCFMKGVFWDELQELGIPCELIEQKSRFDLSVLDRLKELCDDGVDVIHCHGARANFIAMFLKKRVGIPMITTIHSDYRLDFDGFYRKLVYTSLNIVALRSFSYYIGVSSSFKDMLIRRSFRPNSVFTVYNGMNYDGTPPYVSKEEFASRVGLAYDPACTYIGLIGRHDYVKGHDVFIKAIRRVAEECPEARFVIAGEGENRTSLVALAEKEGVSDLLTFVGFVKDIYSFINFIDINTLTSRSESFPYVLLEGARFSKPTVCSRVGGIPDLILDGKTGLLFESENSGELAEKLIRLIRDRQSAKRYGEALHERAVTQFSDTALAEKHMRIYRAVLRDHADRDYRYDAVLSGYYGFHNSGDDALFFAISDSLRRYMPDVRLCVLSAKAKEMRRVYRVDCLPRFSPLGVRYALKHAKMLISGGGSLIQDATSSQSLLYYLTIMDLASRYGCKVFVYANGIGPIREQNVARAAKTLRKTDVITLRDELSLGEITRMGLPEEAAVVTADPALLLDGVDRDAADELLKKANVPADGRFIGFSVREWNEDRGAFIEALACLARYARERYGLTPLFIPLRHTQDAAISKEIASKCGGAYVLDEPYGVSETIGLVARCDVMVGMRLHALIYASGACVPSIGLIYDKKVSGFLDYIGQKRYLDVEKPDEKALCGMLDEIERDRDRIVCELTEKKKTLAEKALLNAGMAVDVLTDGEGK